jgi:BRO1-like domain
LVSDILYSVFILRRVHLPGNASVYVRYRSCQHSLRTGVHPVQPRSYACGPRCIRKQNCRRRNKEGLHIFSGSGLLTRISVAEVSDVMAKTTAGVLQHLVDVVLPLIRLTPDEPQPCSPDLYPPTISAFIQLSLAQAQECFWQKAVYGQKPRIACFSQFTRMA